MPLGPWVLSVNEQRVTDEKVENFETTRSQLTGLRAHNSLVCSYYIGFESITSLLYKQETQIINAS